MDDQNLPDKAYLYCNSCAEQSEYKFDSAVLSKWLVNKKNVVEAHKALQSVILYGFGLEHYIEHNLFKFFLSHSDHVVDVNYEQIQAD